MPKVSRETAQVERHGPVEDRHADLEGGYTVNFVTFDVDMDGTELLRGLPDDRCQSPHWGYVVKGRLTYRTDDGDEVHEAGDAFYLPAGHIPLVAAGTEYLQFSPTEQLRPVAEHMARRAAELMGQPTS
jgi:quercetin dioxygenase-like cupin family protein